jgi:hypothetical protein
MPEVERKPGNYLPRFLRLIKVAHAWRIASAKKIEVRRDQGSDLARHQHLIITHIDGMAPGPASRHFVSQPT